MTYNPDIHHRRSIRLKEYDYSSAGAYFVTICAQHRECLFGDISDGELILTDAGRMLETIWQELPNRFPTIELDEFIVMPNHFHAIILMPDLWGEPCVRPVFSVHDVFHDIVIKIKSKRRANTRFAPTGTDHKILTNHIPYSIVKT